MNLSAYARSQMAILLANTAAAFSAAVGEQFTATPSIAQTINDAIVEDGNWFLQLINGAVPVGEVQGQKVILGLSGRVSGRTDTSGNGARSAKHLAALGTKDFQLYKTDSDVGIKYQLIDTWAKFPDFVDRYMRAVRQAIANDRLMIGWHGTSAAADTDLVANPLLQDVNIGWLELLRQYDGGSKVVTGTEGAPIELGGVDFPNLDTLVHDAKQRIHIALRKDPDLVALVSDDLMAAEKGEYYVQQGHRPTEKAKLNDRMIVDTYGGLPSYVPPFMPDGTVLVTSLNNLSIYYQDSSWRRTQKDHPEKDQYEDFNSRNEGYVVEQEEKASLVEGITIATAG